MKVANDSFVQPWKCNCSLKNNAFKEKNLWIILVTNMKKRSCSFRIRDHTYTLISDQICILIQNDQPEKSDLDWTIVYT